MSDSGVVGTSSSAVAEKVSVGEKKVSAKKATSGSKVKKSAAPSHPPTQQMVDASIKNLKERGGSSLLAIKKYISATYKCDAQKLAPFIKKYLKSSVASGKLIQTKGKGASGSFKLSAVVAKKSKSAIPKSSGASTEKKPKKAAGAGGVSKKKTGTATATATKKVAGEKKIKKSAVATKKTAEKKKADKTKAKEAKKAGTVKAKSTKPKSSSVAKAKAPKAKSTTAAAAKPKKVASAPKKAAPKKPAAKK